MKNQQIGGCTVIWDRDSDLRDEGFRDSVPGTESFSGHGPGPVQIPDCNCNVFLLSFDINIVILCVVLVF